MAGNLGQTSLKCRRRSGNPMRDFDQLPPELRAWLSRAVLPWRPQSVRRVFDRALRQTRNVERALEALDRLEARQIARDTGKVWGLGHPHAAVPLRR